MPPNDAHQSSTPTLPKDGIEVEHEDWQPSPNRVKMANVRIKRMMAQ
jgi:hypothetical protein